MQRKGGKSHRHNHGRSASQSSSFQSNTRAQSKEDEVGFLLKTDVSSTISSDPPAERSSHHSACLVCYTDELPYHRAISPCGHDDVCALCHLRLRSLHGTFTCPVCKTVNDKLIVDVDDQNIAVPDPDVRGDKSSPIHHRLFHQYEMWGEDLGPNFVYRDDVGMFFPISYYKKNVVPLFSFRCLEKGCHYLNDSLERQVSTAQKTQKTGDPAVVTGRTTSLKSLQDHLRSKHSLTICTLCVDNKMDFVSCLPRFTNAQLKDHEAKGDPNGAFRGHPKCDFCQPQRFYDLTKLHEHLNREHYKCHLCDKAGRINQFFKNYDKLVIHFDKDHYLCRHPQCLSARFVVFDNDIDLRSHEISIHGTARSTGGGTKIQIEFRVRRPGQDIQDLEQSVPTDQDFRYGLDGEVFVPEALPSQRQQVNEPVITYGPHAERTAQIRAEAERTRLMRHQNESFPSLGASNENRINFFGWTSEGVASSLPRTNPRALTEQNFPSLESTNPLSRHNVTSVGMRSNNTLPRGDAKRSSLTASYRDLSLTSSNPSASSSLFNNSVQVKQPSLSFSTIPSDFPALGPAGLGRSSSDHNLRYPTAEAYVKKRNSNSSDPLIQLSTSDFPSLAIPPKTGKVKVQSNTKVPEKPTGVTNIWSSSSTVQMTTSKESLDAGVAQVETIKAYLGAPKYKQLKLLTRNFASNEIHGESFVDQALCLFDDGIQDPIMWQFLPSLIRSIPNDQSSRKALLYLDQLGVAYGLKNNI